MQKKISGITFIKNGLTLGYPIKESVESILPICDEVVINIGFDNPELKGDDGTWDYLNDHFKGSKFIFQKSWWDPAKRKDGLVLSEQTNIALSAATGDYIQYIQGDEALHEQDHQNILDKVKIMDQRPEIDGLIFNYCHFYGNVNIEKFSKNIYKREVRLIRNNKSILSWKDAQGFRFPNGTKLHCLPVDATVYHYGWARKESIMNKKIDTFNKLYHGADHKSDSFQYNRFWGLRPFTGTHPRVMGAWIEQHKNDIDIMNLPLKLTAKDIRLIISDTIEKHTGYRIGEYKNFILEK